MMVSTVLCRGNLKEDSEFSSLLKDYDSMACLEWTLKFWNGSVMHFFPGSSGSTWYFVNNTICTKTGQISYR